MGVGPARQPRSPLAFPSRGWATFPTLGTVPHRPQFIHLSADGHLGCFHLLVIVKSATIASSVSQQPECSHSDSLHNKDSPRYVWVSLWALHKTDVLFQVLGAASAANALCGQTAMPHVATTTGGPEPSCQPCPVLCTVLTQVLQEG